MLYEGSQGPGGSDEGQSLKWAKKWAHPDQDRTEWGGSVRQTGREAEVG